MKKRPAGTPHKSTTHEELFFHVNNDATVFFRKEAGDMWYYSVALRSSLDQFCRATGRTVARRKYFTKGHTFACSERPTYDHAVEAAADTVFKYLSR